MEIDSSGTCVGSKKEREFLCRDTRYIHPRTSFTCLSMCVVFITGDQLLCPVDEPQQLGGNDHQNDEEHERRGLHEACGRGGGLRGEERWDE